MCRGNRIKKIAKLIKNTYEDYTVLDIIQSRHILVCPVNKGFTSKGAYERLNGIQFIYINTELSEYERHMTLLHELAHAILHPDISTLYLAKHDKVALAKYEKEADIFAAEFLLDDDIKEKLTENSISDVAKDECVSEKLLQLKINNLDIPSLSPTI